MDKNLRYIKIIKILTAYYNIKEDEFNNILKKKENKYILLLILKNNNCLFMDDIKKLLAIKTNRCILNNLKRAEEKLLINKEFRRDYFEIEDLVEKM